MNKGITLCLLSIIFIFSAGFVFYNMNDDNTFATQNFRIEKDGEGIWRIRDLNGHSQGVINAASNDNINWQSRNSEVVFAFPKDVDTYFEFRGELFEEWQNPKA